MLELNRIYNMDFKEGISLIDDNSIDLILTDIPYEISKNNNFKTMKDRKGRVGIDFGDWDKNFRINDLILLVAKVKEGGSIFLFHSFEQYSEIKEVFEKGDLELKDRIIWEKTNPMPRNRDRRWISNIEMASWYVKGCEKWTFNRQNEKYESSVLRYPSESGGGYKRYHPTQKNLEMIKYILRIHSNVNDIVLDPFAGRGTTLVACKELGRRYIGFEINEDYVKVINERLANIYI